MAPAPGGTAHAAVCRALVDNQGQCRHFQPSLTGRIVRPNKSLAPIARGILDRADQTPRARVLSEAPWREEEVHRRRRRVMLQPTTPQRRRRRAALVVIDDPLGAHVGRLVADVDRHYQHGDGTSPLAPPPVTSLSVRGPGRVPLGRRRSRRDEERPQGDATVAKPFPALPIRTDPKARHRLPQQVAPGLLQEPACRARHEPFRTKMALAMALGEEALRGPGPFGGVVFDAWSLAADVVRGLARRRKAWISRRTQTRLLATARLHLREAHGWAMTRPGPHLAGEELVPLICAHAERPSKGQAQTSGGFTLAVRIPTPGQVRIVVSCAHEALTGRALVLVTNRVDGSAATIISLALQRWPTEPCSQAGKGPLGCNASRMRRAEAMGTHWCLVVVA